MAAAATPLLGASAAPARPAPTTIEQSQMHGPRDINLQGGQFGQCPTKIPFLTDYPKNTWNSCYLAWPTAMVLGAAAIGCGVYAYAERRDNKKHLCGRCRTRNVVIAASQVHTDRLNSGDAVEMRTLSRVHKRGHPATRQPTDASRRSVGAEQSRHNSVTRTRRRSVNHTPADIRQWPR